MFADRIQAGHQLAQRLIDLRGSESVVLGLPRGGVPVAALVAEALELPLDVIVVRKLGLPGQPEVAMGAIGEGGARVLNPTIVSRGWISEQEIEDAERTERRTLEERLAMFREGRPPVDLRGRTAVIVDDGIATGATARVAALVARRLGAGEIVIAAPVIAPGAVEELEDADRLSCVLLPAGFRAVGDYYRDFAPTPDSEVVRLLREASLRPVRRRAEPGDPQDREAAEDVIELAAPLTTADDLEALARRAARSRFICLGEASHGTHEFYAWRAALTKRLIEGDGVRWIGVEGDWPDCFRIDRWVRGHVEQWRDARELLREFDRWPRWMWANTDVADFLDWLHTYNMARPAEERVGFYGLDVYSLWESLEAVIDWLAANAPDDLPGALRAWRCFEPYGEDPQEYAWATRLVPRSCEPDVVALLTSVRERAGLPTPGFEDDESRLDVLQNALVAADAEHYYRVMLRGDRDSWNVRDIHMADTADRLAEHTGPGSKGVIWAHNTHVGDARGTTMGGDGMVNIGQLLRERHGLDDVFLLGFATRRGTVLAARSWGSTETAYRLPGARAGSHEDLLGRTLTGPAVLSFAAATGREWLTRERGHRAVGVVYDPRREAGNYVPTVMGRRYDALIWIPETTALTPLSHEAEPVSPELETEPTGF
ncbi:erythromycin esterase family protein [Leifsonia sp. AG29]|uniref:erythromycin esterase family protein n=1 Tax=Leifsonia sp. AG29 TaxID=2598860 RepID=UPI001E3A8A83|nr:erythromycin esterase family protein [Leifsonia sp. AG29]